MGIRSSEQKVRGSPFALATEHGSLRADLVQHNAEVLDAGLQVGDRNVSTREAGPATIVQDQPRERGQTPEDAPEVSVLPDRVYVPEPIELIYEVDRTFADGLIGDVRLVWRLGVCSVAQRHQPFIRAPCRQKRLSACSRRVARTQSSRY